MSPETRTVEPHISIDDIRSRAEAVKTKAVSEAKGAVDAVVGEENGRTLLMIAGVVVVAASLAFFLGARSGRAMAAERLLGE
jgi:hypothetical protein